MVCRGAGFSNFNTGYLNSSSYSSPVFNQALQQGFQQQQCFQQPICPPQVQSSFQNYAGSGTYGVNSGKNGFWGIFALVIPALIAVAGGVFGAKTGKGGSQDQSSASTNSEQAYINPSGDGTSGVTPTTVQPPLQPASFPVRQASAPTWGVNNTQPMTSAPVVAAQPVYRCPMHPEVQQTRPGNCPKCGMNLQLQQQQSFPA